MLRFVVAHFMVFLSFMNLSIGNWKTFWVLHAITASAVVQVSQRQHMMGRTP